MRTSGTILEIMAWIVFAASLAFGLAALTSPRGGGFELAVVYVASGLISGALLFGIGNAFFFIEDMAIDVRLAREANEKSLLANDRQAEALERLVSQRRREQPSGENPLVRESVIKPISK